MNLLTFGGREDRMLRKGGWVCYATKHSGMGRPRIYHRSESLSWMPWPARSNGRRRSAGLCGWFLEGRHDKEIAIELHLKVPTVRTYLRRTFDKTGASDRRELMAIAYARVSEMRAAKTPE